MTKQSYITVFGASGKVGRELLPFLSEAKIPTLAVTRNKATAKKMPFIQWVEADMADRESLDRTMENSRLVFLPSSVGEKFVEEQNNVIKVAKAQGVEHIVKISSPGVAKDSPFFIARLNYETEELLKASGLNWTILQPNSFMQNWLGEFSETVKKERKIYEATGDGKKPFIDTRDIAEVVFRILTSPERHINQTYLLTADDAVSYGQIAEAISKAIGEKVDFISLTPEEAKQRMEKKGMPPFLIQTFMAIADGQRNGNAAFVNHHARDILGNQPKKLMILQTIMPAGLNRQINTSTYFKR